LEAEGVYVQAARPIAFKPLLTIEIVVEVARRSSHGTSPKGAFEMNTPSVPHAASRDGDYAYAHADISARYNVMMGLVLPPKLTLHDEDAESHLSKTRGGEILTG
jgi:hypothetical protein